MRDIGKRPVMKIAIIGSGLSGLACADYLSASGQDVHLFDKARGPGGRMSTRRAQTSDGQASFDHGAQYFTARDPAFQSQVNEWQNLGVAARWPTAGDDAWVGLPAMNSPLKTMTAQQNVTWSCRIDSIAKTQDGWQLQTETSSIENPIEANFDAVLVAVPAEQAAVLLTPLEPAFADIAAAATSAPCWTLMLAFAEPLKTDRTIFRDDAVIGWAARNSDKPGRMGPDSWVIQASPEWSLTHLEDDADQVVGALSDRFAELMQTQLPIPSVAAAHRWRYARSANTKLGALYNENLKLGVCGDWMLGPRVECAWLSGTTLAKMIQNKT